MNHIPGPTPYLDIGIVAATGVSLGCIVKL